MLHARGFFGFFLMRCVCLPHSIAHEFIYIHCTQPARADQGIVPTPTGRGPSGLGSAKRDFMTNVQQLHTTYSRLVECLGGALERLLWPHLWLSGSSSLEQKPKNFFRHVPTIRPLQRIDFFENAAKIILAEDHLSPSIAAGLFPDLLQRFVPYPLESLDRARAFERSIEQSWHTLVSEERNPFAENFRDLWSSTGKAPMLLLNTTAVGTGKHLHLSAMARRRLQHFLELWRRQDIQLR